KRRALIARIPLHGGELEILGEGSVPAVAPDGSLIYATTTPEGSVLWARREGGAARELARFEGEILSVAAGADALLLGRRKRAGRGVDGFPLLGRPPEPQPHGPIRVIPAPRGPPRIVAMLTPAHVLDIEVLPDAARPPVARLESRYVAWDPEGRAIYHETAQALRRLDIASGLDTEVAKVVDNPIVGLAVSPDGATLYTSEQEVREVRRVITNFAARPRPWRLPSDFRAGHPA